MIRRIFLAGSAVLAMLAAVLAVGCASVPSGLEQEAAPAFNDDAEAAPVVQVAAPELPRKNEEGCYDQRSSDFAADAGAITELADAIFRFSAETAGEVMLGKGASADAAVSAAADAPVGAAVNANYSPASLYYALAMAAQGADGATRAQLLDVLGAQDSDEWLSAYKSLFMALYVNDRAETKLANSLWLSRGGSFRQAFLDELSGGFFASAYEVRFGTAETDAAMGDWISRNTGGLLKPSLATDSAMLMALVNAVHFKAAWSAEFSEDATEKDVFHARAADVEADFMTRTQHGRTSYLREDGYTRARLHFVDGSRMTFILPAEGAGPADLLADPAALREALAKPDNASAEVTYHVPKFAFDSSYGNLPETLKRLGATDAFGESADFSRMTDEDACISDIIQETRISIDEHGAEAAAYTEVAFETLSAIVEEPLERFDFRLDRPFLYVLEADVASLLSDGLAASDRALRIPLFIGMVGNPAT